MRSRLSPLAALLLTVLAMTAFALSFLNLQAALPQHEWRQALWQPDIDNIAQMLFHYSLLPRLAVSLLVGAGLGLVGVLFQQVLRNPLAEPTTLGVATGAQLGMTVTTLWAIPGVLASQFRRAGGGLSCRGAGFRRLVGKTAVAGNPDSCRSGGQSVLRGAEPADGYFPSRSAAKYVPVEHRYADANRLERGATAVAAAARRPHVNVAAAASPHADGAG